ncbi:hypothetical protein K474DRAFT_1596542, partial [Panus rudis PR-1116 ss-1]
IFAYLEPKDLLSLARSTKAFRAFLMNRSAAPCWKTARRNVEDLPDLPPGWTEPAFAHLFFDAFCHRCLNMNVGDIYWAIRGRYCKQCLKAITSVTFCLTPTFKFVYSLQNTGGCCSKFT